MIFAKIQARQHAYFIVSFILLTFLYLWDGFLTGNEAQTIANVYHFAHPGWLQNDWFLSLDTIYRLPFNVFLFPVAKLFSLPLLSIISRAILIALMSLALSELLKNFSLSLVAVALFVIITFRMKGMLAGEDMLWHVEAKILSYISVIFALSSYLQWKYVRMWLFFGAAAAFHPLVGGYSVISLLFLFFFLEAEEKKSIVRGAPFFLATGWPGIGVVAFNLINSSNASGGIADLIYVARHPHHMLPSRFIRHVHKGFPEWLDIGIILGNVGFCVLVLVASFFILKRGSSLKKLVYYTIASSALFIIGLLLFYGKQYHLLKYYPFRFPDVMLPFTSYLVFFYLLDQKFLHNKKRLSVLLLAVLISITGLGFIKETYRIATLSQPITMHSEKEEQVKISAWIRKNTPREAVFIIDPTIDNFHVTAQRAQFVSFKHIPQSEQHVLEWYKRLVLLNGGNDFYNGGVHFEADNVKTNYYNLSDSQLQEIQEKYKVDYYIGPSHRQGNAKQVFGTENKAIYLLK